MDINTALFSHLLPDMDPTPTPSNLRPFRDVPSLGPEEIVYALSTSSNTSAPGPDQIPYRIWKEVNKANPSVLLALLGPLLKYGFHRASLKEANGIILSKPGQPDYSAPSLFLFIVLLQTVSKILERIIVSGLSHRARMVGLVKHNQCGFLPGLSMFAACAALSQEVHTLQRLALKASTLFLDINGGFDNISYLVLTSLLRRKGIPHYLVSWVRSILTERKCQLVFQSSANVFLPVRWVPHKVHLFLLYCS